MTNTPKVVKVIGTRPSHIPTDWPIFNAPRPLYGEPTWTGDFIHGVFYATVDPTDPYGPGFIIRNADLDAWQLEWVSEEEVVIEAMQWLTSEYPIEAKEIDPADPEHREWLIASWRDNQKR